jgi:hypothetical protein
MMTEININQQYNQEKMIGSNIIHALIELATDNELYTILSNESKYK